MRKSRNRFKKVLLINPPELKMNGYLSVPLGLLYLAAYLREKEKGVVVDIVDGALRGERAVIQKIKAFSPDLVGITALTPSRHQALKTARLAKKFRPFSKVVLGGVHPTLMWEQMMKHYKEIDFIVRGEGEITFFELVTGKELEEISGLVWRNRKGLIINNKDRSLVPNLDNLPFPAWEMIDPLSYPAWGKGKVDGIDLGKEVRFPIVFSRGCMGVCTFCSSWRIWRGHRSRRGRKVADEVEFLVKKYGAKHLCFYDDTFGGDRKEVINFCREIVKRKIKVAIVGSTRVDLVDEKLLAWLKKVGFYELAFGIESGSPRMLAKINKKNDLSEIEEAVSFTKKVGIKASALMMYGLPEETDEDKRLTEKLLDKIQPDAIGSIGEVWIFPGTALYIQAKNAGLINDKFWLGKRPYYVYRGGIRNDPINWKLKIRDFLKFHFSGTFLDKIRIKLLLLKEGVLGKEERVRAKTACFLCGSQEFKKLFFADGFWIVRCQKCGLVVTLDKELKRASRSSLKVYEEEFYLKHYLGEEMQAMFKERARKRLKEIEEFTKGRKILDVGCSYGTFMKTAQDKGWQVEGIEPCKKTVWFLRKNTDLKVHYGTLAEVKLRKKFDVISYWDVLEHTSDPVKELIMAKKYLKEGGILALQMPNFGSFLARIAKERFDWLCPHDHLAHFTPETLTLTLKKAGFRVLKIETWSGGKNHFLDLFNALFPKKDLIRPIRFIFLKLGVFLDRFFPIFGSIFSWLQSLFLVNGLIIVYARKQ
jgi:radical SAM superfamily enzyme YgiQ (UPF0313 family)/2-polyprenyl-3-methyl-5-hydroxy-6-metoxy-1,4-benzoquinol methylase